MHGPQNRSRIEKLHEWMPEAIERWNTSMQNDDAQVESRFADMFRRALRANIVIR